MFKRKIFKPLTSKSVVFWTYDHILATNCISSAGVNKPVQVFPVYPSLHAHCNNEQTVLPSKSVHSEVDVHSIPTTAETVKGNPYMVKNTSYYANFSFTFGPSMAIHNNYFL